MKKLWQTQTTKLHPLVEQYTVGIDHELDRNLLEFDVEASIAHAKALEKAGIITAQELETLINALKDVLELFKKGEFKIEQSDEDCHTAVENYLVEKYGDLGKKIHTGRSRNDQVLVATRLYTRSKLKEISAEVVELQKVFLKIAKEYEFVSLPGYTHTRRAMPSSVGHWAAAYLEEFINHHMILEAAFKLNNQNPLGAAAGFGVNLDIDRNLTTELLGFDRTQVNSLYCVNSRGPIESHILSVLSQIMMTLGRLATEMIWMTTPEFDFFDLPFEFTTGSSIMPQKRNPDVFEVLRGNVSVFIGYQTQVREICKNLISGYNRDTQLTKEPLIKGLNLAMKSLEIAVLVMPEVKPKKERLAKSLAPELFATYKANKYVQEGMPFRDAYQKVKENIDEISAPSQDELKKEISTLGSPWNLGLDGYEISKGL
ncbi:MAG: argininosuccinate lyase [bacterium]